MITNRPGKVQCTTRPDMLERNASSRSLPSLHGLRVDTPGRRPPPAAMRSHDIVQPLGQLTLTAASVAIAALSLPPSSPAAPQQSAGEPVQARSRQAAVEVRVTGVSGRLRRNVRHHLSIADVPDGGALEERIRRLHDRAPAEIRRALEPFGLYRASVDASLERRSGESWRATYRIAPGPAVPIGTFELEVVGPARLDSTLRALVRESPVRAGAALNHAEYERLKSRLLEAARNRGYLDARLTRHRVDVDLEEYTARVRVGLESGPRFRYGEVRFSDTTTFSRSFLERFQPVREGDDYSLSELVGLQNRLAGSGYFRVAEVHAPRDSASGVRVPVSVRIEPRPRTALSVGLGASTDRGPRVSAQWEARRLDAGGHRLALEARASLYRQTSSVRYAVPVGLPGYEDVVASAGFQREEFQDAVTRTLRGAVGVIHQRGSWRETVQLQAEREWFTLGGEESTATLVLPRVGWSRASRDETLAPTRAGRISLDLQGTTTGIGSDVSFLQAELGAGLIRSPYRGSRILLRGEIGLTAVGELDRLPGSLRFYAGGDQSVRGYAYRSLAPRDSAGNLVGGRHLGVGSVELEQRIVGPFGAAAFVDVGTAARRVSGLDEPSVGTGLGARWRSPLGPVRLDLAFALSGDGTPARLHLVVGPDL